MVQHRQILGVMAKTRNSVIMMRDDLVHSTLPEEGGSRIIFQDGIRVAERSVSGTSISPSHGVDHECQEASEGFWCTSGRSPAAGLDAVVSGRLV